MGERHRTVGLTEVELALTLHELGRADESRAMLADAAGLAPLDNSRQIGNLPDRLNLALGQIALDDGRLDEALSRLRNAATRWAPGGGANSALVVVTLAEAESRHGDFGAADGDLHKALPVIDAQLGPGSLAARRTRCVLGELDMRRGGHLDEARLAFAAVLSDANDKPAAASPTRNWLRARAKLDLAQLSATSDPAQTFRLVSDARSLVAPPGSSRRDRALITEAAALEARVRVAAGS
jgi:tetratricopeptide (TPR) repeat protein